MIFIIFLLRVLRMLSLSICTLMLFHFCSFVNQLHEHRWGSYFTFTEILQTELAFK